MIEGATKPLTAEMKKWMQQLVEDSKEKLQKCIKEEMRTLEDTTTTQTRKLQDTIRDQIKQQNKDMSLLVGQSVSQLEEGITKQTKQVQDSVADATTTLRSEAKQQTELITYQISKGMIVNLNKSLEHNTHSVSMTAVCYLNVGV